MKITRECKVVPLNWGALPELPACLSRHRVIFERATVQIEGFPDSMEYSSLEAAYKDVLKNGPPRLYKIEVHAKQGEQYINIRLWSGVTVSGFRFLSLSISGVDDTQLVDAISSFLGLQPAEPATVSPRAARTAFIAHRFDNVGTAAADKVARFLELLGFQVVTGRAYTPGPVSDKVRTRLEQQALMFAVLTPGDDITWLTQESLLAHVKGKPLFLLKEQTTSFKAALLSDHEYIPFDSISIETTFIPILEGLRELGYFSEE